MASPATTFSATSPPEPRIRQRKRPDMPLYVPRGRQQMNKGKTDTNHEEKKVNSRKSYPPVNNELEANLKSKESTVVTDTLKVVEDAKEKIPEKDEVREESSMVDTDEKMEKLSIEDDKPPTENLETTIVQEEMMEESIKETTDDIKDEKCSTTLPPIFTSPSPEKSTEELNKSVFSCQTNSSSTLLNGFQESLQERPSDEDSWDSKFTDEGECLQPEMLKELTVSVGDVSISKTAQNYEEYAPKEINAQDEFGHIVELYDFPAIFKDQDIMTILKIKKNYDLDIKWVDHTHALAVCSGVMAAEELLRLNHPMLKLRPLSQGTPDSKRKARRIAELVQPFKHRPETSVTMARRFITHSLGIRDNVSKEQRALERKQLRDFKEKKKQAKIDKEAAWEGKY